MDQAMLAILHQYFDRVHSVTMKAIEAISDADLDFRPKPGMRTPRELLFHIYSQEKILAEAAREGQLTAGAAGRSNPEEQAAASGG